MSKALFCLVQVTLLSCFLFQGWMSVKKFLPGDTVKVQRREFRTHLDMPMLTLCKRGTKELDEEGQIRVKESDPLIVLPFFCQAYAGDTKKCFEERLFNKDEMIESIYPEIMNVFNNRTFGEQKMDEWTRNPKPFDVEMHLLPGTPYGMCFRVKLQLERLAIGGDHAAVMKLVPGLYDLYLHDHKMLLFNFYTPSKFKVHLQLNSPDDDLELFSGHYVGVEQEDVTLMNKPESPCETDEEYNLYECWRKGVHDQLGCLIFARNNTNERECETEEELDIYIKWFLKGLNNHKESALEELGCPMPCHFNDYNAHQDFMVKNNEVQIDRKFFAIPDNFYGNLVTMMFSSGYVTVTKEELLYDGYALLGETGGSLGLFLGLSILSVFGSVYKWLGKKCNKKK